MNIIVFGSTGAIGRQLVKQALELGHRVTSFNGDVSNFNLVLQSVRGQNLVMAASLKGIRNIVRAMKTAGLERLICRTNFWQRMREQYIRSSGLHWTIVRHGWLTNGPITGSYRHGVVPLWKISRADVALFMLMQITDHAYIHQSPAISY